MIDALQIYKFTPFTSLPKGSSYVLICNVISSNRMLEFNFLKNNQEIKPKSGVIDSTRYQIDSKHMFSQFSLFNLNENDSGNYSCIVTDQNGQRDVQWTILEVRGMLILFLLEHWLILPKRGAIDFAF